MLVGKHWEVALHETLCSIRGEWPSIKASWMTLNNITLDQQENPSTSGLKKSMIRAIDSKTLRRFIDKV